MRNLLLVLILLFSVNINVVANDRIGEQHQHIITLINQFNPAHDALLKKYHEDKISGVTSRMVNAIKAESTLLFEYLVAVESYLEGKSDDDIRYVIIRDQKAISKYNYMKGHKFGWGGTAVKADVASAERDHLLNRLIYYVVRIHMKDEDAFDLNTWLKTLDTDMPDV